MKRSWVPNKKTLIAMGGFLLCYIPPSFFFTRAHTSYLPIAVGGGIAGVFLAYWLLRGLE